MHVSQQSICTLYRKQKATAFNNIATCTRHALCLQVLSWYSTWTGTRTKLFTCAAECWILPYWHYYMISCTCTCACIVDTCSPTVINPSPTCSCLTWKQIRAAMGWSWATHTLSLSRLFPLKHRYVHVRALIDTYAVVINVLQVAHSLALVPYTHVNMW